MSPPTKRPRTGVQQQQQSLQQTQTLQQREDTDIQMEDSENAVQQDSFVESATSVVYLALTDHEALE